MDRLNGKVAIVTGAGKKGEVDGTGYATSILFAREGAKVLLADLSPENANATLAEIEAEGGEASVFIGDVSTEDSLCWDGRSRRRTFWESERPL